MFCLAITPVDSAAVTPGTLVLAQFNDRDDLIRHMFTEWGWSPKRIATVHKISTRHVRRIKAATAPSVKPTPGKASKPARRGRDRCLTDEEIRSLGNDYANDPYMSAEDREFALEWLQTQKN